MDRVYQSDVSTTPPAAPFPGSAGFTQSAVDWANFTPTTVGPYYYHYITESCITVILAAGLTPDPLNLRQLAQAIEIIAAGGP
jgi:hypothetical protein